MNLYQTVQYILSVAKVQPNIGLAYEGDVYRLNELQNIQYPAIVVSQNTHGESGEFRSYSFFVFYVDRLLSDKSNRLEVQTIGLEVLSNIYKVLIESGFETEGEVRFHPFDERFDSECAGMYMEIALQSLESLCADGEMPYIPGGGGIEPSWFNPADYYTSAQTDERITEAISEISLDDYYTSAQTDSKIAEAVSAITVSGVTRAELDEAIAAETARTESTYLKEVPISTTATTGVVKVGSGLTIDSGGTLSTDIKEIHFVVTDTGSTEQASIYEEIKSAITNNYFDASKYRFYASFHYDGYNEDTEQEIKIYAWEKSDDGRIFFNLLIGNNRSERELQIYSKKWFLYENGDFRDVSSIKQDLQFKLTAGTGIEITSANTINCTVTGITSAETQQLIEQAMAAETARTEQTYLKEHQSLADYYTSGQTDSAISTAVQDKVSSTTIAQIWTGSQAQYDAMTGHSANILYIINS